MKRSLLARRVVAGAGVAAVVLAGFAGASAATAIDNPTKVDTLAQVTGTPVVEFHKHVGAVGLNTDGTVDGQPVSPAPAGEAISGVVFKLTPILCGGVAPDLLTQAGWNAISGLKTDGTFSTTLSKGDNAVEPDTACAIDANADHVITAAATDTNGVSTVNTGLTHTAYLVTEEDNANISTKTPNFILTLPTRTADHKWINQVTLYPKNAKKSDASKVAGKPVGVVLQNGEEVTTDTYIPWTVTATVPAPSDGTVNAFWLDDKIQANQELVTTGDYAPKVTVGSTTVDPDLYVMPTTGTGWTANDGYTTAAWTSAADGNNVRFAVPDVDADTDGYQPAAGTNVTITFYTKVKASAIESATDAGVDFKNDGANIFVDGENVTPGTAGHLQDPGTDPDNPTDPAVKFTKLNMSKVAAGSAVALSNAKFDVYVKDDTATTTVPGATTVKAKKLTASEFETNAQGAFSNPLVVAPGTYYLVETQAPGGYQTPAQGNYVTVEVAADGALTVTGTGITASDVSEGTVGGEDYVPTVKVENVRGALDPSMGLPITGAQGLMLLTIGGLVIVAAGVGVLVAVRRRQAAAE